MPKRLLVLLPIIAVACVIAGVCLFLFLFPPEWEEYRSTEGRFTVRFPETPVPKTVPHKDASGKVTQFHLVGVRRHGAEGFGYAVQYFDRPNPPGDKVAEATYLKEVQAAAQLGAKGKLLAEKEIDLNGVPGREFSIKGTKDTCMRYRVYAVGARTYTLWFSAKDEKALDSETARKFFKSFQLLK
jgi:hypothetical protein